SFILGYSLLRRRWKQRLSTRRARRAPWLSRPAALIPSAILSGLVLAVGLVVVTEKSAGTDYSKMLWRLDSRSPFKVIAAAPIAHDETTREYHVSAIHVLMPLNRFGDHDPEAYMYALDCNIPSVRTQEAAFRDALETQGRFDCVTPGLRKDAIQP